MLSGLGSPYCFVDLSAFIAPPGECTVNVPHLLVDHDSIGFPLLKLADNPGHMPINFRTNVFDLAEMFGNVRFILSFISKSLMSPE